MNWGLAFVTAGLLLGAPAAGQAQTRDYCALLRSKPEWGAPLMNAAKTWRVSPGTILAIIDQESRFRADARGPGAQGVNPARNFGYAQANLRTWNWYARETGKPDAPRTDFALAADFIGWHFAGVEKRLGLPTHQISEHYLVYKLGEGGYRRGAPASARAQAQSLAARSRIAEQQLSTCGLDAGATPERKNQAPRD